MNSLMDLNNKDQNLNKFDSKQLFKKCKQVIKQQKQQIQKLIDQNQRLKQINEQANQALTKKQQCYKLIALEISETKHKNQLLHKQLAKSKQITQNMSQKISTLQSNIKLQSNKIQYFQKQLDEAAFQKQQLQTKQELIQQTVMLMDTQNQTLRKVLREKQNQIIDQISQVKKLNSLLKRKHQMQNLQGDFSSNHTINDLYIRPFQISSQQILSRSNRSPTQNPQHIMKYLNSTDYKRSKSNPKKTTSKKYERSSQDQKLLKTSPILQLSRNTFSFTPNQKDKLKRGPNSLQNQLKDIKSSILEQYNKMQNKKQDQNKTLINNTLKQIQNKLGRMMKVAENNQYSDEEF